MAVSVIGGGPGGIVAAKSLLEQGLEPVILEQHTSLGGQWRHGSQEQRLDAVWRAG